MSITPVGGTFSSPVSLVCAGAPAFSICTVNPTLDDERGGRFQIQPQLKERRVRQLYLPDTNILLTRFLAEEGVAE
jgi:hypothetical protein